MVCNHLRELYQLCESHQLRIGGSDLIRLVCKTCNEHEVCPSMLMDEYDARYKKDVDGLSTVEPAANVRCLGRQESVVSAAAPAPVSSLLWRRGD